MIDIIILLINTRTQTQTKEYGEVNRHSSISGSLFACLSLFCCFGVVNESLCTVRTCLAVRNLDRNEIYDK